LAQILFHGCLSFDANLDSARAMANMGSPKAYIQSKAGPLSRDIFVNDLLAMERHSQMRVGNLIDGF
jgi:hypothetical protein